MAVGAIGAIGAVSAVSAVRPKLLRTANTMRVEDFGAYWTGTKVSLAGRNAGVSVLLPIPLAAVLAPLAHKPGATFRGVAVIVGLTTACLGIHLAGYRELTFLRHAPVCLGLYLYLGPGSPGSQ